MGPDLVQRGFLADAVEASAAHGPVSTVPTACPRASWTMVSGTPKPLAAGPPVAAKIVVTTRPRASTIGPPELPERTGPRSEVIRRCMGPGHRRLG